MPTKILEVNVQREPELNRIIVGLCREGPWTVYKRLLRTHRIDEVDYGRVHYPYELTTRNFGSHGLELKYVKGIPGAEITGKLKDIVSSLPCKRDPAQLVLELEDLLENRYPRPEWAQSFWQSELKKAKPRPDWAQWQSELKKAKASQP